MTAEDLAAKISEAIKGTPFKLHDFGAGIMAVPFPVPPERDRVGIQIILEKISDAHLKI